MGSLRRLWDVRNQVDFFISGLGSWVGGWWYHLLKGNESVWRGKSRLH